MQKNDNFYSDMGKRIVSRRKQLGLSQEELAEIADVSPQMISTAERGSKSILSENLLKLSDALGVTADYLLTGKVTAAQANIITEKILNSPPEIQNKIERIINIMLEK